MAYRLVRAVIVGLTRLWLHVDINGTEKIPATGPFVLAPTHRANIDFLLTGLVSSRRLQFMTKDTVWRIRPLGAFVSLMGGFPVHRGTPDRAAINRSLDALAAGDGLVLFPEGQRRSGPVVEGLHDGVAYIASRAGVPIIPIAIAGSEDANPPGRGFIRPRARISIVVGEPLIPDSSASGRVPRAAVRELTTALNERLQALLDAAASSH